MDMSLALEPTFTLDVRAKTAKHWIIVGAGGTGGYLIPNLFRQISLQNRMLRLERRPEHRVTIIEGDAVEDKNLVRQNFLPRDVGYNKGEVMANRYGGAFGIEVDYISEYLEKPETLLELGLGRMPVVFVDCVDNNKTRSIIHEAFKKRRDTFSLSSGNEEWAGQVVVGYNYGIPVDTTRRDPHLFDLPDVADIFPEILNGEDKLPTELSCAERAVSNPQNIQTNQTAANLLMNYANTILTANAEEGEGLKSHMVIFNTQAPSFSTTLNKARFLLPQAPPEAAPAVPVEVEVVKKETAKAKKKKAAEVAVEA